MAYMLATFDFRWFVWVAIVLVAFLPLTLAKSFMIYKSKYKLSSCCYAIISVVIYNQYYICIEMVQCPLCIRWEFPAAYAAHRVSCAEENSARLSAMSTKHPSLRCPTCDRLLLTWAKWRKRGTWPWSDGTDGPVHEADIAFKCSAADCPQPNWYNEGYNQFTCFLCDHNLCLDCANAVIAKAVRIRLFDKDIKITWITHLLCRQKRHLPCKLFLRRPKMAAMEIKIRSRRRTKSLTMRREESNRGANLLVLSRSYKVRLF